MALSSQTIAVAGTVYREANASIAPLTKIVHVGDTGQASIVIANSQPDDGYSESLIASLIAVSNGIDVVSAGPTGDIIAEQTNDTALTIGFSTAQAGTISGTGTIGLISDGGVGDGSIDGLGTSALPSQDVPIDITVDNYAVAQLRSPGNLTSTGADAYTLNVGSAAQGSTALSAELP